MSLVSNSLSTYTTTTTSGSKVMTVSEMEYAMQELYYKLNKEMAYQQKMNNYSYYPPTNYFYDEWNTILKGETKAKKGKDMSIVTKLKNINLDEGDRLLRKHGIVDDSGDLTTNGKAVLMNMLLDSMKEKLVENLKALEVSDKPKKKAE